MPNRHAPKHPGDLPLNQWELRLMLGEEWEYFSHILQNFYCSCGEIGRELVDYKVFLDNHNDIILRGSCSICDSPAARTISTSEVEENVIVAKRIRKEKNK